MNCSKRVLYLNIICQSDKTPVSYPSLLCHTLQWQVSIGHLLAGLKVERLADMNSRKVILKWLWWEFQKWSCFFNYLSVQLPLTFSSEDIVFNVCRHSHFRQVILSCHCISSSSLKMPDRKRLLIKPGCQAPVKLLWVKGACVFRFPHSELYGYANSTDHCWHCGE